MDEPFRLPEGVASPDFIIAAIGRSGSTMLTNWLCRPPNQLAFVEPFFLHRSNPRLLRIQLDDFGMGASDAEWAVADETAGDRFARLMGPRLQGRRWAVKEVLCAEHRAMIDALAPPKVIICVRAIGDVALSFFEKHRAQNNVDRFSDEWVRDYCVRESQGLVDLHRQLKDRKIPALIVRYEDFIASIEHRTGIERFTGWTAGGNVVSHLERFDRGFEIERHGKSISSESIGRKLRRLPDDNLLLASGLEQYCRDYSLEFGYC